MLTVYTLKDAVRWDEIVRSFKSYDVYYLSGYVKAFQIHGDGEPLLFLYEGEELRGINVVMKRDIVKDPHLIGLMPENMYFDFATPYGYGGWLLEGVGDSASLFSAYEEWCRENGIVSEFVRFHPVAAKHEAVQEYYEVVGLGKTIAMDLASPEAVWANLTSKNRNMIRKAQKNGLQIYNGRFPTIYETFRDIYNDTMDKDHAEKYYYFAPAFYESVLNDLPQNAQVFYAQMKDGTIIAASIMLAANGQLHYHLSGGRKEFQHLAPTNLLLYKTALWGCDNGCKVLYLGGGVGYAEDSLYQFKKSFFRGAPGQFCVGKKIFLPETYKEMTALRKGELLNSRYFPAYRAPTQEI